MSKPIGERIKERREAAGLTQEQLASKAGINRSNLTQIETGDRADPRISTVAAIARALGVAIDDLVPAPPAAKKPRRGR